MDNPIAREVLVPTAAGEMDGWLCEPGGAPRAAVLVCPEIFGIAAHTRARVADLAAAGYVALALDLCYRRAPRLALARDDAGRARGLELFRELRRDSVLSDLSAAIAFLSRRHPSIVRTAVVGFSSGGHLAYLAACRLPVRVAVSFYGGWLTDPELPLGPEPTIALTPGMRDTGARLMYLVGSDDFLVPEAVRAQIARALAGVRHDLVVYPGAAHGFMFEDSATSRAAWARCLAALADELA